jgi:hypothetical protein
LHPAWCLLPGRPAAPHRDDPVAQRTPLSLPRPGDKPIINDPSRHERAADVRTRPQAAAAAARLLTVAPIDVIAHARPSMKVLFAPPEWGGAVVLAHLAHRAGWPPLEALRRALAEGAEPASSAASSAAESAPRARRARLTCYNRLA